MKDGIAKVEKGRGVRGQERERERERQQERGAQSGNGIKVAKARISKYCWDKFVFAQKLSSHK